MKKRTAFIGAILSLMPIGQPFLLKGGVNLVTSAFIIFHHEKINAASAQYFFNRGNNKLFAKDYKGAISEFTEAIKINPRYADAYNERGYAKEQLEDYKGAISDYTEAIKINPRYAYAYNNRGYAKRYSKDLNGALSDFSRAIKINSQLADAYYGRSQVKILLEDYEGGVSDNNKALKIYSKESFELSIKDILSPQILKGKEIKYKAYKKFGRFKDETYLKPITYYIHDKTSRKTLEISDDEERFIVDFFNYIDPYIDLDFERVDSKGKAIMRFYKTISEDKDSIGGTGNMNEPETLSGKFYLDLSWSESKVIYPRMKNYPTLSIDDAHTIAHEIGHALGLEHYDEGSKDISYSNFDPNDVRINSSHTVMSYYVFLYPRTLNNFYTELDIKALQKIWGVEKNN